MAQWCCIARCGAEAPCESQAMGHTDIALSLTHAEGEASSEPRARDLQQARICAVMRAFNEAQNVAGTACLELRGPAPAEASDA